MCVIHSAPNISKYLEECWILSVAMGAILAIATHYKDVNQTLGHPPRVGCYFGFKVVLPVG